MDYQLPQPNTLGDIYSMNPGAFTQAQGLMDLGGQFAQQGLQKNAQDLQFNEQANPLRLESMGLGNDTSRAALPGITANSGMLQRKNNMESQLEPQMLASMRDKYGAEALSNYGKVFDELGDIYSQGATAVAANPIAGKAALKERLQAAGHPEMWNPEWDNLQGRDLFESINATGQQMQRSGSKFTQTMAQLNAKQDFAKDLQAQKDLANMARVESMNARAKAIENLKEAAKKALDKPTMEGLAGRYSALAQEAMSAGDSEKAQEYYALANKTLTEARAIKAAGAATTNAPKINVPGVTDLPAVGGQAPPSLGVPGPSQGASGNKPGDFKSPPSEAVQLLISNPALAEYFDKKYGKGAAQAVLKGQ